MQARMAFAVATVVRPEILIVDEVLAVGDAAFQRKCEERIHQMLEGSVTILLVSHSNETVNRLCKHAIWIRQGEVAMSGAASDVCAAYAESSQQ
jgi:ABC-type polysaccharide/polyol phosphate transport system ATPase subunit